MTTYLLTDAAPLGEGRTDLLLADGVIAAMGADARTRAGQDAVTIDATGLVLLPGLVDRKSVV